MGPETLRRSDAPHCAVWTRTGRPFFRCHLVSVVDFFLNGSGPERIFSPVWTQLVSDGNKLLWINVSGRTAVRFLPVQDQGLVWTRKGEFLPLVPDRHLPLGVYVFVHQEGGPAGSGWCASLTDACRSSAGLRPAFVLALLQRRAGRTVYRSRSMCLEAV